MDEIKPFKSNTKSPVKRNEASIKKKDDVKSVLLHTLNIIPHILFVIVNIVKNNKFAILPTISFINNFIDNNYVEIASTTGNQDAVQKSKKFVKKFTEVFLKTYSKTALVDKGLILLAFIDIISNEIPGILREANKIKFVDPTKIFIRILINAKEIDKEYKK